MPTDGNLELVFPLDGLYESVEYQQQPGGTAAEALNVRGDDCRTRRERGASRPGLSQFIPDPVHGLGNEVQHLTTIVTTGLAALSGAYTVPHERINVDYVLLGPDAFGNPGWVIPVGGSGIQPNRNLPNNGDDFNEQALQIGTVSSGSQVILAINNTLVTASTVSGVVPVVGSKHIVVPVDPGPSWYYQPPVWL